MRADHLGRLDGRVGVATADQVGSLTDSRGWIARNAGQLLAGQVLAQALVFVQGALVARTIGDAEYGRYTAAIAFAGMFAGLCVMGMDGLVVREVARSRSSAGRIVANAMLYSLLWALLSLGILWIAVNLVGYSGDVRLLVVLAGLTQILVGLANVLRGIARGFENMLLDALSRTLHAALGLLLVYLCLQSFPSAQGTISALLVASGLSLLATALLLRRIVRGGLRLEQDLLVRLARASIPLGLSLTVMSAYTRLDVVLLSLWRPEQEVGLYGAAYGLVVPWNLIALALSTTMVPSLSRLYHSDEDGFLKTWSDGARYVLIAAAPVAAGLAILGRPIVGAIFGSQYLEGAQVLVLLGPMIGVQFANTYLMNSLISADRQNWLVVMASANWLTTLILGVALVPILGMMGSALTALLRECVGLLVLGSVTLRRFRRLPVGRSVARPLLAAAILAVCLFLWGQTGYSIWFAVPVMALVYFLALVATGAVKRVEIRQLLGVFGRRRRSGKATQAGDGEG